MTAQQTAAKAEERLRIRRALLALYVDARSVWLYRESVIAAIKKATRAPAKGRRRSQPEAAKGAGVIGHPDRCVCWRCATPEQNRLSLEKSIAARARKGRR